MAVRDGRNNGAAINFTVDEAAIASAVTRSVMESFDNVDQAVATAVNQLGKALRDNLRFDQYFKDIDVLSEKVDDAFSKFSSDRSINNAEELVKLYNALSARSEEAARSISGSLENFHAVMADASSLFADAGKYDVGAFREMFTVFESLKAVGVDVENTFGQIFANTDNVRSMREQITALENDLNRSSEELYQTQERLHEVSQELFDAKSNGRINEFNELVRTARREFNAFLIANNIDRSDFRLSDIFDEIEQGALTSGEAITRLKSELPELLPRDASAGIEPFLAKMEEVLMRMDEMQASIRELGTISPQSGISTGAVDGTEAITQESEAVRELVSQSPAVQDFAALLASIIRLGNETGDGTSDVNSQITPLVDTLRSLADVDAGKLQSLGRVFSGLASINGIKIHPAAMNNLQSGLEGISRIQDTGALKELSEVDFRKFNELKPNKAALENLATYLPVIAGVDADNLKKLEGLDLSAFSNLKVPDVSTDSISSLAEFGRALSETVTGVNALTNSLNVAGVSGAASLQNLVSNGLSRGQIGSVLKSGLGADGMFTTKTSLQHIGMTADEADRIASQLGEMYGNIKSVSAEWKTFANGARDAAVITVEAVGDVGETLSQKLIYTLREVKDEAGNVRSEWKLDEAGKVDIDFSAAEKALEATRKADERSYQEFLKHQEEKERAVLRESEAAQKADEKSYQEYVKYQEAKERAALKESEAAQKADEKSYENYVKYQEAREREAQKESNAAQKLADDRQKLAEQMADGRSDVARERYRAEEIAAQKEQAAEEKSYQEFVKRQEAKELAAQKESEAAQKAAQKITASEDKAYEEYVKNQEAKERAAQKEYETAVKVAEAKQRAEEKQRSADQEKEIEALGNQYDALSVSIEKSASALRGPWSEVSEEHKNDLSEIQSALQTSKEWYDSGLINTEDYAEILNGLAQSYSALDRSVQESSVSQKKAAAEERKLTKETLDSLNARRRVNAEVRNATKILNEYSAAELSRNATSREAYKEIGRFRGELQNLNAQYSAGEISLADYQQKWREYSGEISRNAAIIELNGDAHMTAFGKIGKAIKTHLTTLSATTIIGTVMREIRQMVEAVKEIDTAMTELRKVTDETDARYEQFLTNAGTRAKALSATISDTVMATADFARLGLSIDEAEAAADAAIVYKSVGDNIESIDDAAESIISTMKAFGIEASDAMSIVDKFNKVGNEFAIGSNGVGEALKRSASAMYAANNTLEETIGLATAANTILQNPQSVGTTLKTISMYVRAAKADLEEAGEETEGIAESSAKLRELILQITRTGGKAVDIMADENTFKSTYQILEEISEVWDKISDVNQAALLEKLGGKRNANAIAAILENFSIAREAMEAASNADGSALGELSKYQESIEGHIVALKTAFQELSSTVIDSDLVKTIVDIGRLFLELLTGTARLVERFGGLRTVLVAVGGAFLTMNINSVVSGFNDLASVLGSITRSGFSVKTLFAQLATQGIGLSTAVGAVTVALTAAVAIYSALKKKEEERRTGIARAAETASAAGREITELIKQYGELSLAVETDDSKKKDLDETTQRLIDRLGLEGDAVGKLAGRYDSLTAAIRETSAEKLREVRRDLQAEYNEIRDELVKQANGNFWNPDNPNTIGISGVITNSEVAGMMALRSRGLIRDYNTGNYIAGNSGYELVGDFDLETPEGVIEAYQKLGQMLDVLDSLNIKDGSLRDSIYKQYAGLKTQVESYSDTVDKLNENLMDSVYVDTVLGKAIPETREEFDRIRNGIINNIAASGKYVGSLQDIESAVDSMLKSAGEYSAFYAESSASGIEGAVKKQISTFSTFKEEISSLGAALAEFQEQGNVSSETYNRLAESNEKYKDLFAFTGNGIELQTDKLNTYIETLEQEYGAKMALEGASADEIGVMVALGNTLVTTAEDTGSAAAEIKELRGYIDKLNEGAELSWDEIQALQKKYPKLTGAVKEGAKGYRLEISAIEDLIAVKAQYIKLTETESDVVQARNSLNLYNNGNTAASSKIEEIFTNFETAHGRLITSMEDFAEGYALVFGEAFEGTYDEYLTLVEAMIRKNQALTLEMKLQGNAVEDTMDGYDPNVVDETAKNIESLTSELEGLHKNLKELNEGTEYSTGEIITLLTKYPALRDHIYKTANGYKVETSAIRDLISAKLQLIATADKEARIASARTALVSLTKDANAEKADAVFAKFLTENGRNIETIEEYKEAYKDLYHFAAKASLDYARAKIEALAASDLDGVMAELYNDYLGDNYMEGYRPEKETKSEKDEETEFEKAYKYHQHMLEMDRETVEQYLGWLDGAYKASYAAGEMELDDYYKYEEEVYEGRKQLFQTSLDEMQHRIDLLSHQLGDTSEEQIALYEQMQRKVSAMADVYRARGISDNDELIRELQNQWWQYEENIRQLRESAFSDWLSDRKYAIDQIRQNDRYYIEPPAENTSELRAERDALAKRTEALNEYIEAYGYLVDIENEAREAGYTDTNETVFGNIDTNNRQILDWTQENINKYRNILASWGYAEEDLQEMLGSYATVMGTSMNFDGLEIAFSPILQTENGPVLLSSDTVEEYIWGLLDKLNANGGTWYDEDLFRLDTQGLEFDGRIIRNLLASIGDDAIRVGEVMHYAGSDGALADAMSLLADTAEDAGVSLDNFRETISDIIAEAESGSEKIGEINEAIEDAKNASQAAASPIMVLRSKMDDVVDSWKEVLKRINDEIAYYTSHGYDITTDVIQNLMNELQGAKDAILDALDEVVSKANEVVDGFENVYKTLVNAGREYASTGYLSVDSLQSILALGPQYLDMLYNEAGQLNINEETLQKVIAARTDEMAVETALNYAKQILLATENDEVERLRELSGIQTETVSNTWDAAYATIGYAKALGMAKGIGAEYYDNAYRNITKMQSLSRTAVSSIGAYYETLQDGYVSQADGLEQILKLTEDMIKQENEDRVKELEDEKKLYKDIIDEKKEILRLTKEQDDHDRDMADKLKEIADLQSRIDQLALDDSREAGAQRAKLEAELLEKQKALADDQADYAYDAQVDSLDNQYDAYEKEKDDEIDALKGELSSAEKLYRAAIDRISNGWDTLYDDLVTWNYNYGSTLEKDLVRAWDAAKAAAERYGSFVAALDGTKEYANVGSASVTDYIDRMRKNSLSWFTASDQGHYASENQKLAGVYSTETGNSLTYKNGSWYQNGSPAPIYTLSKDEVGNAIVTEMKANSAAWAGAGESVRRELERANEDLALRLQNFTGTPVTKTQAGVWLYNGKPLYEVTKFHTGGIVGGRGSIRQNEVMALLKKGESVLDEKREQALYKTVDFVQVLSDKIGRAIDKGKLSSLLSGTGTTITKNLVPALAGGGIGTMNFSPTISVTIAGAGDLNESTARKYGTIAANTALEQLKSAFAQRGVSAAGNSILK